MDPDIVIWDLVQAFLSEAADRGFEHAILLTDPHRNAYFLMRDYADWLEGALHLIDEQEIDASPLDPIHVGEHSILTDCWQERADPSRRHGHTFRIVDRPNAIVHPNWNELLSSLALDSVTIHTLILPATVKDRLPSPLVLAYQHPLTSKLRLATLETERGRVQFTDKWLRLARWEMEGTLAIHWPEWREGIERDQCLDKCYRETTVESVNCDALELSAKAIAGEVTRDKGCRKQEACRRCYMDGYCNGGPDERDSYRVIS
jgi:hypothetical protein